MTGGCGEPDAAAVVAAIEASTGVTFEANLGQPSPVMLETSLAVLGLPASECSMVGDRPHTYIAAAPPDRRPTFVVEGIDLLQAPLASCGAV